RIRRKAVDVAPLTFREQHVESECRFAGAGDPGNNTKLVARDRYGDILQVVLASTGDGDIAGGSGGPMRVRPALRQLRCASALAEGFECRSRERPACDELRRSSLGHY